MIVESRNNLTATDPHRYNIILEFRYFSDFISFTYYLKLHHTRNYMELFSKKVCIICVFLLNEISPRFNITVLFSI